MATHHRNPNTHGRKAQGGNGRTQRPAQLAKRHSSHGVPRVSSAKNVQIRENEAEDDMMAASFLNYCATCEKQIATPSNSILYCSESCRRKDTNRTPAYAELIDSPPMTPLQTSLSFERLPVHDIIPQRSPTAAIPVSNRYSYSSFSEDETLYSEDEKYSSSRRESEAQRYLRQFSQPVQTTDSASRTPRPQYKRTSTNFSTISQAPSLSHSPSSTIAGMSFPYTPSVSRPLPPRTNPSFSTSFKYSRSIDLVSPFPTMTKMNPTTAPSSLANRRKSLKSGATSTTSHGFAEGEIMYEKAPILSTSAGHGSLKKMFRFNEMQAPPSRY